MSKFIWTCPVCNGNEYDKAKKSSHICKESLLERSMKISTNGKIVKMNKEEIANAKKELQLIKKNLKEKKEPNPDIAKVEEKFLETCSSVMKALDTVKNEKELAAIEERFTKAFEKYTKVNPDRSPEIVGKILKKIEDLRKEFSTKK